MKRILAMALSIALVATLAISGTIAYLTDNDSDTNTFVVGNVIIDQREWQRDQIVRADSSQGSDYYYNVQRLDDGKSNTKMPLYPAVITGNKKTNVEAKNGKTVSMLIIDDNFENYIDKIVDVENKGKSDAYVRTIVAIPTAGLDNIAEGNDWIHFNWNDQTKTNNKQDWVQRSIGVSTIGGKKYQLYEFTYQPVLVGSDHNNNTDGKDNITSPSLLGVWMDPGVDFTVTDKDKLEGYYVYNGKQLEDISELEILVASQACQADGFNDAATALNTAFGVTTISNHPFGTTTEASDSVSTVQDNDGNTIYYLKTTADLYWFAKQVNEEGKTFAGDTVVLQKDITFDSTDVWEPIGQTLETEFQGTFNGQGHTITGMRVVKTYKNQYYSSGFFGWIEEGRPTIQNVKFDKASVEGYHYAGVVAGYCQSGGTISDVTVTNSTVTSYHHDEDACGDKAGAIVGYLGGRMTNASASKCTIKACRDAGMLVGCVTNASLISNDCSASNVSVSAHDGADCCSNAENHGGNCTGENLYARIG